MVSGLNGLIFTYCSFAVLVVLQVCGHWSQDPQSVMIVPAQRVARVHAMQCMKADERFQDNSEAVQSKSLPSAVQGKIYG